jgi:hypothetical protein
MCDLCGNKVADTRYANTDCCRHKCHQKCLDICQNYLIGCPLCKHKFPDIRIRLEYGNFFTYSDRHERLLAFKDKFLDCIFGFGRRVTIYIPRSGDLDVCADVKRLECDDLVHELNDCIDWDT